MGKNVYGSAAEKIDYLFIEVLSVCLIEVEVVDIIIDNNFRF